MLYLGPSAVDALLCIQPQEAVIDPATSVFGLSPGQISRRIKASTKMAGLGEGCSAHSPRVGTARYLSAAGAELPELMTAGRRDNPTITVRYTPGCPTGDPAYGPAHGRGRGDFIGGPDMETAVCTTGLPVRRLNQRAQNASLIVYPFGHM